MFHLEGENKDTMDILTDMYYELTDKHGYNLIVYIPDQEENQGVFDVFNEPDGDLSVCVLVGTLGKRSRIKGEPNLRSAFIDLSKKGKLPSQTVNAKDMPAKLRRRMIDLYGKEVEYYPTGRTWTAENGSQIAVEMVDMCDTFVGFWDDGEHLQSLTRFANSLGKEVVLIDL